MGCGGSKTKDKEGKNEPAKEEKPAEKTHAHKKLEREHWELEQKANKVQVEIDAIKKEQEARKQKASANAKRATGDNVAFEAVVSGEQYAALEKLEGVTIFNVLGLGAPVLDSRENVVIISTPKKTLVAVIEAITCPATVEKSIKLKPEAPPVVDKAAVAAKDGEEPGSPKKDGEEPGSPKKDGEEGEKKEGEDAEKKEEEKKEEEKKEEEAPKISVPDSTMKVSTDVDFITHEWDGVVPLTFTWVEEPSMFSEYNDPAGSNWNCFTNVRKAPGMPENVKLEWRQGMMADWQTIDAKKDPKKDPNFQAKMTLNPEKKDDLTGGTKSVSGSDYRGFQTRWVVDGDKYLSPLQLAPTLISKLMTYPSVRGAIKALPPGKQEIKNIENEHMRKALMTVENIIPMNTWDVEYGLTKMPGAYLHNEHVVTIFEKAEMIAKEKANDPSIQAEIRKTILKSPIMIANAAAGTVGVKLDMIIANMDFFLPKMTDPDFAKLEEAEKSGLLWEATRRDMQIDVNEMYPNFQNGLRVTFPSAHVLQNAMKTKRPVAEPVKMPVRFSFKVEDDDMALEKKAIKIVYWKDGEDFETTKVEAELDAAEEKEKFGVKREEKSVWRNYKVTLELFPAVYKYHWVYEDKPFFNNGCPFGEEFQPGESYHTFSLMCAVQFGIGVQM